LEEGVQEFWTGVQELQEFRSCRMGRAFRFMNGDDPLNRLDKYDLRASDSTGEEEDRIQNSGV
jgi:hypothetical protein